MAFSKFKYLSIKNRYTDASKLNIHTFLVSVEDLHEVTNHPVHIVRKDGQLSPSALIPFCSFGGNMTAMGVQSEHFHLPVCNAFKEVVLEAQVCYQVDLNNYEREERKYLDSSLTFLVDTNIERQISDKELTRQTFGENVLDQTSHRSMETHKTMVYIGTLGTVKNMDLFTNTKFSVWNK